MHIKARARVCVIPIILRLCRKQKDLRRKEKHSFPGGLKLFNMKGKHPFSIEYAVYFSKPAEAYSKNVAVLLLL
jgi:hypothetical protein